MYVYPLPSPSLPFSLLPPHPAEECWDGDPYGCISPLPPEHPRSDSFSPTDMDCRHSRVVTGPRHCLPVLSLGESRSVWLVWHSRSVTTVCCGENVVDTRHATIFMGQSHIVYHNTIMIWICCDMLPITTLNRYRALALTIDTACSVDRYKGLDISTIIACVKIDMA